MHVLLSSDRYVVRQPAFIRPIPSTDPKIFTRELDVGDEVSLTGVVKRLGGDEMHRFAQTVDGLWVRLATPQGLCIVCTCMSSISNFPFLCMQMCVCFM